MKLDNDTICQCCSCEKVFEYEQITNDGSCPNCDSGNWVYGYMDEPEPVFEK